jgi:Zn-dependent M28 family amino/carboxypeptidase
MSLATTVPVCWWIGLAALLAAIPSGHIVSAENATSGAPAAAVHGGTANEGVFRHLRALQDIASATGGDRAAGTLGYDRSATYVAERLREAGYLVRLEEFEFAFFEERASPILHTIMPSGRQEPAVGTVRTLEKSGSSDVMARLRPVRLGLDAGPPQASTSGCEIADFEGFERGSVALIRRGTCPFQTKVANAVAAGAVGVIIMNEGTDGRTDAFSGELSQLVTVPVVGIAYELGRSLDIAARGGAMVRLAVNALSGKRLTRNVLAATNFDRDAPTVVVGAHLDSVLEGPGINDNGSGSAAVLEAALRLGGQLREGVRFAFWGAEERGLIGSHYHVSSLSERERRQISLYVNLDMVGSPNFARFVLASTVGNRLATIARRELLSDFREHNLAAEERVRDFYRSDDASFSRQGIPTVGLYTGASESKLEAQVSAFGGAAGRPYDPCYHRACDTIDNVDRDVLEQNTRALVRALSTTGRMLIEP